MATQTVTSTTITTSSPMDKNMSLPALLQMRVRRVMTQRRGADIHVETRQGKQHMNDGTPNQDICYAMVRTKKNKHEKRLISGGVFDGHGLQGHVASKIASIQMEKTIDSLILNEQKQSISKIMTSAFEETSSLVGKSKCSQSSGTTASVIIIKDDQLCIGWVGDSIAVIVSDGNKQDKQNSNIRFAANMHRVTDQNEAHRILKSGGRIQDGYVVDTDAKNGIAVTRTLGDVDMHQYGCISEPQIARLTLHKHDAVIIVATDGLWDTEGITAELVLQIASDKKGRTAKRICQQLMAAVEEADGPSDDCTIACVTLR